MRALRLLAVLVLAAACGCARQSVAAVPPRATPLAAAPASPAWSASELRRLRERLSGPLGRSALATSGIAILDTQGRALFVRRERAAAIPASTFKLLVAVTALQMLGPDYRFETRLEALDGPHNGTLDGDLYLVGDGDPSLTADVLRGGVGTIARSGVTNVTGGVVADATLFGAREINPAWEPDDLQYGYAAGTSALSLDGGTIEFHIVPSSVGAPARIDPRPPSDAVRVLGGVLTGYNTTLSIDRAAARNDFTFSGGISVNAEQSFYRPVIDQPLYVAGVANSMLRARNVAVEVRPRTGVAPVVGTVLWRHYSAPLRTLLNHMLFESDNHYAEQLLRAVGAHAGTVGTRVRAPRWNGRCSNSWAHPPRGCGSSTAAGLRPRIASRRSRSRRCSHGLTSCDR